MGATDLLSASEGEVIEVDMSQPVGELAAYVDDLVGNEAPLLADVGAGAGLRPQTQSSWCSCCKMGLPQQATLLHDI